jgi:hypothetical protein
MWGHPTEERLLELAEGGVQPETRAHVAACDACRAQVDDLRALLRELPAVDVPEPSPLYWDAFRRRIGERLDASPAPARRWSWLVGPALVAASAAVVAFVLPRGATLPGPSTPPSLAAVLPAWTPLPELEDDDGLAVLQAFASVDGLTLEECRGLDECAAEAGAHDAEGLARALGERTGGGKS